MHLWSKLIDSLPQNCRWTLAGDWNMVPEPRDKTSRNGRTISDSEKLSFNDLLSSLVVHDTFEPSNGLRYTWDNHRRDHSRIMARLDIIYTPTPHLYDGLSLIKEHLIGDSIHSDHHPVWYSLQLKHEASRRSHFCMNARFLDDLVVRQAFEQIWFSHPTLGFFGKLRRCVKFYKTFCWDQAMRDRLAESEKRLELSNLLEALQSDPTNSSLQASLSDCASEL